MWEPTLERFRASAGIHDESRRTRRKGPSMELLEGKELEAGKLPFPKKGEKKEGNISVCITKLDISIFWGGEKMLGFKDCFFLTNLILI